MNLGSRVTLAIAGRAVPGRIASAPEPTTITTPSGRRIPVLQAEVISLRTTRDGSRQYLMRSVESLRFLFPRTNTVPGLDVDDTGAPLPIDRLYEAVLASTLEWQAQRSGAPVSELALD